MMSASMRPRHKAAEYHSHTGTDQPQGETASMRPRHKAAEYLHLLRVEIAPFRLLQ